MSDAMPLFEFVRDGARQLAIVVRRSGTAPASKYNFPTEAAAALQVGVTFYQGGDRVAAHAHYPRPPLAQASHEFVLIQEGLVEVTIFREDGTEVATLELGNGDAVLFQDGGHALRCLQPTRLIEVKQGPYVTPEQDKYRLPLPTPGGSRK